MLRPLLELRLPVPHSKPRYELILVFSRKERVFEVGRSLVFVDLDMDRAGCGDFLLSLAPRLYTLVPGGRGSCSRMLIGSFYDRISCSLEVHRAK